ncbi:LOW QUALITY PROTEIN: Fc receptor-like protein 6 [Glossophaga mutica]
MTVSPLTSLVITVQDSPPELRTHLYPELFLPPNRGLHPVLHTPTSREGDCGLNWCREAFESGRIQKQSPQMEIRVWAPVSYPLLTLHSVHGLTVRDVVKLLCEARRSSPPILCSFYLDGEILGNFSALHSGAASLFLFKEEHVVTPDANHSASFVPIQNAFLDSSSMFMVIPDHPPGPCILSFLTSSNWLVLWLPASQLDVLVTAATLLGYFRSWRKTC